jgi:probable HAF family extracellular repeat protein
MFNRVSAISIMALLAYVAPAAGSTIPFFQVTELPPARPSEFTDRPTGLNEDAAVVGLVFGAHPRPGFLWTPGEGMRNLARLAGTDGFDPRAINDFGRIAGSARVDDVIFQPVLWDAARGVVVLTPPGSPLLGEALDISNTDLAVGWVRDGVGPERAFVWDSVNGMRDLNTLAGISNFERAAAINDSGQVAGETIVNGNSHAVIWDPIDGLLDLTTGIFGFTSDINNHGAVVGWTDFGVVDRVHAFLYQSGEMTDLGALRRSRSYALALNDVGQVVGQAVAGQGIPLGWFYDGDQMWNLNRLIDQSLGWIIVSADDINDAGQIVATARRRHDPFPDHEYILLLDPISGHPPLAEPGTLLLLALGLLGLGVTQRKG